jgi:hypothetical protein
VEGEGNRTNESTDTRRRGDQQLNENKERSTNFLLIIIVHVNIFINQYLANFPGGAAQKGFPNKQRCSQRAFKVVTSAFADGDARLEFHMWPITAAAAAAFTSSLATLVLPATTAAASCAVVMHFDR